MRPSIFRRSKRKREPNGTLTHVFHGIQIIPGSEPCRAVQDIAQGRFLSDEAPRLPLEQCEHPALCNCRYKHYVDRRTERRRASDEGLPQAHHPQEKRRAPGRRITD